MRIHINQSRKIDLQHFLHRKVNMKDGFEQYFKQKIRGHYEFKKIEISS